MIDKRLLLFFIFVAIGLAIYGINTIRYTQSENEQEQTQAGIDNKTDIILLQINKSLDILLEGQETRHNEHDEIVNLIENLTKN